MTKDSKLKATVPEKKAVSNVDIGYLSDFSLTSPALNYQRQSYKVNGKDDRDCNIRGE